MQTAGGAPNVAAGVFFGSIFWTEYFLDRFYCDAVTFSLSLNIFGVCTAVISFVIPPAAARPLT